MSDDWPHCGQCGGIRIPGGDSCLAHAKPEERWAALKQFSKSGELDVRGVTIPDALLKEIFDTAPHNAEGHLTFSAIRFVRATFEGYAGFDGATFEGDAWFTGATFKGEDAWFRGATFKGYTDSTGRPSRATPGSTGRPSRATPGSTGRPSRARHGSTGRPSRARCVQQGDLQGPR